MEQYNKLCKRHRVGYCCLNKKICENWYAVSTISGKELDLINKIECFGCKNFNFFCPKREVLHRVKGVRKVVMQPLFPGYFFVYKNIDIVIETARIINSMHMVKPVSADGIYLNVDKEDMRFLFNITDQNGVVGLSKCCFVENDQVKFIAGPLKNLNGEILFVNKKKNKAKVQISFMNRLLEISLGVEFIKGLN